MLEQRPEERLRLAVVIDEAHQFLYPDPTRAFEPVLLRLAATLRKRGCGLIFATQTPAELPRQIASVLGTRVALHLVDGGSARWVAESMALNREQMEYLLALPDRTAVLHYRPWPTPFLIEVPTLQFPVSAPAPADYMRDALAKMSYVPGSAAGSAAGSARNGATPTELKGGLPAAGKQAPARAGKGLSRELREYLELIAQKPLQPATERDREAGIGLADGNKRRGALEGLGYIALHHVLTGKKGRALITELCSTALQVLSEEGVRPAPVRGRGGLKHQYYQHLIAGWMRQQGWSVEIESGDARADIALEKDGRRVAVEICLTTARYEVTNVEVDLAAGFDEVWIVAEDRGVLERAKRGTEGARHLHVSDLARTIRDDGKRAHTGPGGTSNIGPGDEDGRGREAGNQKSGADERHRLGGEGSNETLSRKPTPKAPSGRSLVQPGGGNSDGEDEERSKKERREGKEARNGNENDLAAAVQAALRVVADPFELARQPLARLPAIAAFSSKRFAGRTGWRGLGLQALLRELAESVAAASGDRKFAAFLTSYLAGDSVKASADAAGVSREYASREFRPQAVARLTAELRALIVKEA